MALDFRAVRGALPRAARKPVEMALIQPGGVTSRNSSSAAILPAATSSTLSQGTQCVGSPRTPVHAEPAARQAASWIVRGRLMSGKASVRQASAAISELIQPVEQSADLRLVEELGPEPRDPGDPLHGVGRVGAGHLG